MRRILFVLWKELLELRQDPRLFPIIFVAPIIQLTLLGYAATTDVKNVPLSSWTPIGRPAAAISSAVSRTSANFTIVDMVGSVNDIDRYLDGGRAWMALVHSRRVRRAMCDGAGPAVVQVVADGSDASSTTVAMGYADKPRGGICTRPRRDTPAEQWRAAAIGGIEPQVRVWFNPRLESRVFMLPGVSRPAAPRDDLHPVVDGDRAREGTGHARAAQCHAARARAAHRRQAAALRDDRHD